MAATYKPTLDRPLDWVRFLTGDKDMSRPTFQDEELNALYLQEGSNRYFAAAAVLRMIQNRGGGLVSKTVGDLSLTYSDSENGALARHIDSLMMQGHREAANAAGKNAIFRTT
jgi:hypothetical protein